MPRISHSTCQTLLSLLFAATLTVWSMPVKAVAYCAIRDPVAVIQQFYPAYTSFKAIEGRVDPTTREAIATRLPLWHKQEFGFHTLYEIYQNQEIIGYLRASQEKGQFGLNEIVWVLDTQFRITTFEYLRYRGTPLSESKLSKWQSIVSRKSREDLEKMVEQDLAAPFHPDPPSPSRHALLKAALKTIILTQAIWPARMLRAKGVENQDG